jgi:PTS system nitrogen regulatory IIA component
MNIVGRYLAQEDVVVGLDVFDKPGALEAIAVLLERRHHFKREPILNALWAREQLGATVLPDGIAFPHAFVEGITHPIAMLARTRIPIRFGSPDHKPISLLLVIVVPEDSTDEHLQILATCAAMFSDAAFRHNLETLADASEMHRLVSEWRDGQN